MDRSRKMEYDPHMSDFEQSDSDGDYDENEKILLNRVRNKGRNKEDEESEEEVLGLHLSDDGENDVLSEDDIRSEEDDLPNAQAWGYNRKGYYSTDYVDQDFGGFQGKDAVAAEYEEKEARAIQERLAKEIDENDYMLDFVPQPAVEKDTAEEKIETDLTNLSKREKLALFAKESPEFAAIVGDFEVKMEELNTKLEPVMQLIEKQMLSPCPATNYIKTKRKLILSYCTNIGFYVMLKAKRVNIQAHPVIQRLFQYRQLLKQLEPIDEQILPQIDTILQAVERGEQLPIKMKQLSMKSELLEEYSDDSEGPLEDSMDINDTEEVQEEQENEEGEEENQRRPITYQIAKNKGLTPRRKKEQRNPRVKHREKYRKAKIRRKGQIREARPEVHKYDGERSGIKLGVIKSIKLK